MPLQYVTKARERLTGWGRRRRLVLASAALLLPLSLYAALGIYAGSPVPLRVIDGTSMEPLLQRGDVVLVRSIGPSEVGVGDIVAFDAPGEATARATSILHRVAAVGVGESGDQLMTKGDNAELDPFSVPSSAVQGRMVARIPGIAAPLLFLTGSGLGLLTAASIALLGVALSLGPVRRLARRTAAPEEAAAQVTVVHEAEAVAAEPL